MEDPKISKELIEAFLPIMEMNNAQFRQVKTMLAGFIAIRIPDDIRSPFPGISVHSE